MDDEDTELNMTPMLDVVFILLIFFIVTSVFVKIPGIEPSKPEAVTCLLYTSPSPRDRQKSRMPSSA